MSDPDEYMSWMEEPCICGDVYSHPDGGDSQCQYCSGAMRMREEWSRLFCEGKLLAEALEEAMEWNWGDESEDIPKDVIWKCENALRAHYGDPVSEGLAPSECDHDWIPLPETVKWCDQYHCNKCGGHKRVNHERV